MINKEFNKVKPYCYILTRLSDGKKYFGYRWYNIKKKELQIKTLENFILAARKQLRINLKKILKNLSLS